MTNVMPQLTLEPQLDVTAGAKSAVEAEVPKAPEVNMDDSLTAEEKQAVEAFVKQIDVTNANQVLMYGAAAQQNISQFSDAALKNVKTKDLDEIGDAIRDACYIKTANTAEGVWDFVAVQTVA